MAHSLSAVSVIKEPPKHRGIGEKKKTRSFVVGEGEQPPGTQFVGDLMEMDGGKPQPLQSNYSGMLSIISKAQKTPLNGGDSAEGKARINSPALDIQTTIRTQDTVDDSAKAVGISKQSTVTGPLTKTL